MSRNGREFAGTNLTLIGYVYPPWIFECALKSMFKFPTIYSTEIFEINILFAQSDHRLSVSGNIGWDNRFYNAKNGHTFWDSTGVGWRQHGLEWLLENNTGIKTNNLYNDSNTTYKEHFPMYRNAPTIQ